MVVFRGYTLDDAPHRYTNSTSWIWSNVKKRKDKVGRGHMGESQGTEWENVDYFWSFFIEYPCEIFNETTLEEPQLK